jgi:hypothetical protein
MGAAHDAMVVPQNGGYGRSLSFAYRRGLGVPQDPEMTIKCATE